MKIKDRTTNLQTYENHKRKNVIQSREEKFLRSNRKVSEGINASGRSTGENYKVDWV